MNHPVTLSSTEVTRVKGNPYRIPLLLMVSLFFMIGFITVLNDVLIPSLKGVFTLNNAQAMLIQFCFFIAYGLVSIPAGRLIQRVGYKNGLSISLAVMAIGLFLFVPAANVLSYAFFLFALFVVATGLTILQVTINPYIIALGPEETGASRLNLGGTLNSTATFIGPIIGAAYILPHGISDPMEKAQAVQGPYLVLALVTIGIAMLLYFLHLPKLATETEGNEQTGEKLTQFSHLIYGAGGIFFYVGAEVAIGSILILYFVEEQLIQLGSTASATLTAEKAAAALVAYYWASAMIGRFIGSIVGQKIRAHIMLRFVAVVAIILVSLAISGVLLDDWMGMQVMVLNLDPFSIGFEPVSFPVSLFLLVLVGLFNSVMWPCIFPLAIRGLGKNTSRGSGLLVSMVAGGALIPLLQGVLVDSFGFQYSFFVVLACYLYILFYAVHGYKVKYTSRTAL
ncbi:sugar MFS transporter [Permianibacter aggregans]|uniref:FHS family L-fucose permease-like MFS transporter n=1 Tax=Permianibacter aggregans TaxID=1510150 RepID=A0A4R6UPA0_9GAMM|nr:sugar MFS transporter [Permianibacter aggregans]QGX40225.1 MFS transporter [Permianibacter aggregans]TDQ47479.1 FHS family L-fucose permease-like MFS transporter [Permianibacter aggregans]